MTSAPQSVPSPPLVGERCTVTVETLAAGGDGIARINGFTVFVPFSAPGDVADVEITRVTRSYGHARLLALQQASPQRVTPPCPLAGQCPGCQLQHLAYPEQLAAKQRFVRDALERIGRVSGVEVSPTLGMDDPWHYRNKAEFAAVNVDGRIALGYHAANGAGFLGVPECPIQHPLSMAVARAVETIATAEDLPLAQLIVRVSEAQGEALAILVCWEWSDRLPAAAKALRAAVPELAGVLCSRVRGKATVRRTLADLLEGRGKLQQQLGAWEYTVSAESFFQVNTRQAERLLATVETYCGDIAGKDVADGYSGVGTFLLPLAKRAGRAFGVEEHPVALRDAEENITRYALRNAKQYEGRAEVIFPRLERKARGLDVAVLDPPRKGAGRPVLESIAALKTSRVVLVSCDPGTLGRDVGDLTTLGYRLVAVQPVDLFPQTWHVETVALAVRDQG
jgi:23S rRNA (uracil1939-C5)-methyltransferase